MACCCGGGVTTCCCAGVIPPKVHITFSGAFSASAVEFAYNAATGHWEATVSAGACGTVAFAFFCVTGTPCTWHLTGDITSSTSVSSYSCPPNFSVSGSNVFSQGPCGGQSFSWTAVP